VPLRVVTGFEHGPVSATSAAKGTSGVKLVEGVTNCTIVTTSPRSGTYCLRCQTTAAAGNWNYGTGTLGTSQTFCTVAFGLRFNGGLPAANVGCMRLDGSASHNPTLFFRQSDSRLVMANSLITQNPAQGPVVAADTWYWITLEMDISGVNSIVDWWVDEAAQPQFSFAGEAGNVINNLNVGGAADTATRDNLIDDLLVWTHTADMGLGSIPRTHIEVATVDTSGQLPSEIGTANAMARFTTNGGGLDATFVAADVANAVDERPATTGASSDGVRQRTSGTGNAVQLNMTPIATKAIQETCLGIGVKVCAWANNATAAANQLGVRAHNGFAEVTLFAAAAYQGDNTADPAWISEVYEGASGATGFTHWFLVNATSVRLGYSGDINPLPGAHAVYLEVALTAGYNPRAQRYRRQVRAPSRNPHGGAFLAA
jgi:hypothetical protein